MDADKFRNLIHQRHQEIVDIGVRASSGTEVVELDQSKVGRLSRMDAMQVQQMNLESERRRSVELAALESALQRIENHEYGHCAQCGEEINLKRLEIDLAATRCISCANKLEKR